MVNAALLADRHLHRVLRKTEKEMRSSKDPDTWQTVLAGTERESGVAREK